ncbi:MAG TPA: universal stress protein [Anaerolineae bacterium]|nr:universal stress protein [Anaerolineae bacterium]HIQ05491.1 universal stress protein [Anaerolineae bacterium]
MGKILCATRGGEASYRTQDQAIALAKKRGDELVFLYVVDLTFLNTTAAPIVVDVEERVKQMGDFLLTMAQERAQREGIQAKVICRRGTVREEIKAAVIEEGATLVVLGRPAGDASAFVQQSLRAFAEEIEQETGAEVVIV